MTSDLLQQTHRGKLSLITLIQNLPHQTFSDLPEIIFDENGRYSKLKEDKTMKKSFLEKAIQQIKTDNQSIHDIIQQQTIPVSSFEEQFNFLAKEFNLPSSFIEKQYELALKNRIEIPRILMRRILIDAIGIFRIMKNEFNQETEKFQRISKRLYELETYNQLFAHHC